MSAGDDERWYVWLLSMEKVNWWIYENCIVHMLRQIKFKSMMQFMSFFFPVFSFNILMKRFCSTYFLSILPLMQLLSELMSSGDENFWEISSRCQSKARFELSFFHRSEMLFFLFGKIEERRQKRRQSFIRQHNVARWCLMGSFVLWFISMINDPIFLLRKQFDPRLHADLRFPVARKNVPRECCKQGIWRILTIFPQQATKRMW